MPVTADTVDSPYVPPMTAYYRFESASTDSLPFLRQLDEMLVLENVDGYTFQAAPHAYENVKRLLETATIILGARRFPQGEFIPDGEGGIDVEWKRNDRLVTLSCRGNSQADYIYWEENGAYEAKDATLTLLVDRLNWLNDA